MQAALRPFATAGVSLVAAGAIAVSPTTPAPAPVPVISSAMQLTAAPAPLEFYAQVTVQALTNALYSITSLPAVTPLFVDEFRAHPGSVLKSAMVNTVRLYFFAAESMISPFVNGIGASFVAFRDVVEAALNLDVVGVFNAVIDIPGRIADGFLNGGYQLLSSPEAGFLSPPGLDFEDVTIGGPVSYPAFAALYILLNRPVPTTVPRHRVYRGIPSGGHHGDANRRGYPSGRSHHHRRPLRSGPTGNNRRNRWRPREGLEPRDRHEHDSAGPGRARDPSTPRHPRRARAPAHRGAIDDSF